MEKIPDSKKYVVVGEVRYCNMANGGPMAVYVKDGKIVRMTPITFDDRDPQPWSIKAKGRG